MKGSTVISTAASPHEEDCPARPCVPDRMSAASDVLTTWKLLAYGGLALPLALAEIPIIVYLPAFYAKELHLAAGLVGVVFLAARLWDGVTDVVIGWLSDRTQSRWGRRKLWVLGATPFLICALWFLCRPAPGAGLLYLAVWAALFYPAWTAVKIPYISWGTELATDYIERNRVATFRESFMMLGNLLFAAAPILFLPPKAPLRDVLYLIAFVVLWAMPIAVALLGLLVRDPVPIRRPETRIFGGLISLARDGVFIRFIAATLLIWTAEGVINSLAVFSFGVGLRLADSLFVIILLLYVAMLCAVPATLRLSRRIEKHRLMTGGMALYAAAVVSMLWVPAGNFPVVAAVWIVAGLGNASIWALPTSVLADIVDHGEVACGEQRSGAYAAIYYLAIKIGLALGVGLSFSLLDVFHFDPSAVHHGDADEQNIRIIGFGLPGVLYAISLALYFKHPITRSIQEQLRLKITARRASRGAPGENSCE